MTAANAEPTAALDSRPPGKRVFDVHWLGQVRYAEALQVQEWLVQERTAGRVQDTILLLEHPAVITLGRGGKREHLLATHDDLRVRGVDFFETGRGGDVTLHAPGQLIAYPILDLNPDRCDVRKYVRDLAKVMIAVALSEGIAAELLDEYIGIWVSPQSKHAFTRDAGPLAKLGAIGVRLSRWVTMHGFALNVTSHPGMGDLIVPCGIHGHEVTSLAALTGRALAPIDDYAVRAAQAFGQVFGAEIRMASAEAGTRLLKESQALTAPR